MSALSYHQRISEERGAALRRIARAAGYAEDEDPNVIAAGVELFVRQHTTKPSSDMKAAKRLRKLKKRVQIVVPLGKGDGPTRAQEGCEALYSLAAELGVPTNRTPEEVRASLAAKLNAKRDDTEIPAGRAVVDAQGLASLRAELTALGKHVDDVERRAYDTPTKAEHIEAFAGRWKDPAAEMRLHDVTHAAGAALADAAPKRGDIQFQVDALRKRIDGHDQRFDRACEQLNDAEDAYRDLVASTKGRASQQELDDFRKATELWQSQHAAQASAMSTNVAHLQQAAELWEASHKGLAEIVGRRCGGLDKRVDVLCETQAREAFAYKQAHERLVSLADRVRANEARLVVVEDTTAGKAETLEAVRSLTDALQALERDCWKRVGDGAFAPPFGTIRVCRHCGALVAGGPNACVDCAKADCEAVIREHEAGYREAPLDLATLRVPTSAGALLRLRDDGEHVALVGPMGSVLAVFAPLSVRLLARALTQWADGAEKGAGR